MGEKADLINRIKNFKEMLFEEENCGYKRESIPASRAFSKEFARDVFEKVDRPITLFAESLKNWERRE